MLTKESTISIAMGRTSDADSRLMDAALSLMWEESYGAITIDIICQRAEVKKGSFYYFFDSKADLAVAALERNWQDQKPLWDAVFSPDTPPLERIRKKCANTYAYQVALKAQTGKVLGCQLCSLGAEMCKQDERIREKVCEILGRQLKYWESAIRDAQHEGLISPGDAAVKARCTVAYYEGLVAQARLHNDAERLRELPDLVCAHLQACASTASNAASKTGRRSTATDTVRKHSTQRTAK